MCISPVITDLQDAKMVDRSIEVLNAMEMEQQLQVAGYCLCLFLAVLPLLLLKLKKQRGGHGVAGPRLPPSPSRLPVIGSLHHLVRGPLPHRAMAELARRHGAPLMYLELGEVRAVVASSPDAAREVLRANDAAFASRPWIPSVRQIMASGAVGLVFARYGPLWRQLRRICAAELLSARRVHSFRGIREDEARRLVAAIAASATRGEAVNVSEQIAAAIADSSVRSMVGDRFDRRDEFLRTVAEGTKLVAGFNLSDLFPSSRLANLLSRTSGQVDKIYRTTFELMDHAITKHEERRATAMAAMPEPDGVTKEQDILDVLLKIQKEGDQQTMPLTMTTIKCVILDLFSGGSDTSASSLQWAMSELMRNPRVMRKAQAEVRGKLQGKPTVTEDDLPDLKYLKLVIKETLRMHPVFPLLLPRECVEDCKVMGYDVAKGTTALVNAWAIGRDPRYWEDSEEFKPERFEDGKFDFRGADFEFIPFGAGCRMCPGIAFAQANMEAMLAALLCHFDWELPGKLPPSELDMSEEMGITVRRKSDLCLCPIVRVPPHAAP